MGLCGTRTAARRFHDEVPMKTPLSANSESLVFISLRLNGIKASMIHPCGWKPNCECRASVFKLIL
jgi:hypothetical protein